MSGFSFVDENFTYHFGLNSLGEVFRNEEYLLGSVNVGDAVKEFGTDAEYSKFRKQRLPRERENALCEMAFDADARKHLTPQEYLVYKQIIALQSVDDGRWRVYGGLLGNHNTGEVVERITLVTEFCDFVDQEDFWKNLDAYAAKHNATIEVMHESENTPLNQAPTRVDVLGAPVDCVDMQQAICLIWMK